MVMVNFILRRLQELREHWYALLAGDGTGSQSAFGTDVAATDVAPFADLRLPDSLRGPVIAAARKASCLSGAVPAHT